MRAFPARRFAGQLSYPVQENLKQCTDAANAQFKIRARFGLRLAYPAHFDRAVSSLFFHHLSWEVKERTAQELFRVLKPGAELHVADWGLATSVVMRGLFMFIQLLDGFKNTQDNVSGRLIALFAEAGFVEVSQRQTFGTAFGTMALYSAYKPSQQFRL